MKEYLGTRTGEQFIYRRVSFPDYIEGQDYGNVIHGKVTRSYFSTVKETATFEFQGGNAPDTKDLVRIYYQFNEQDEPLCVGTYVISYADVKYNTSFGSNIPSGSVSGSSMLSILANRIVGFPLTIPAGTRLVEQAMVLCNAMNLRVSATPSELTSNTSHTFEPADNMLTVVNWLLTTAGYASAGVDAYGYVTMRPYETPDYSTSVFTFENGKNSVIADEVKETNNWSGAPNVVRLYYADDAMELVAWAKDVSASKASLSATNNREITLFEEIQELSAEDVSERLRELENNAVDKLINNSTEIVYLEWACPLLPITIGEPVSVIKNGKEWGLTLTSYEISLEVGTQSKAKGRRFVDAQVRTGIEVGSQCLWIATEEAEIE